MKIVWLTNGILKEASEKTKIKTSLSGAWMQTLFDSVRNFDKSNKYFSIHSSYLCKKFTVSKYNGVEYYTIPRRRFGFLDKYKKEIKIINNILQDIKPDIIHIHGTEEFYGLLTPPKNSKVLITVQGIRSQIIKFLFCAESKTRYIWLCIKNIKPFMLIDPFVFKRLTNIEKEIFIRNKYFAGRTDFDKYNTLSLNPNAKYFSCYNDILREKFYINEWNINKTEKHLIHTTTSTSSIKGFNIIIDMVEVLINKIPNIKINVAGEFDNVTGRKYQKDIKKRKLEKAFQFLGPCNVDQLIDSMLKSQLFVLSSYIENSPLSLIEAQCLGMPCVATYTGGIPTLIENQKTGVFFPIGDSNYLAGTIKELFEKPENLIKLGHEARKEVLFRNDPAGITKKYIDLYSKLMINE